MPKRTDIKSILILGSGPIIIGQACEFDYSGVQACHALKKIGYKIILVNSNPATIMTDPELADVTYIEPIHWEIITKIIKKERPNAILPTMGGQTALNCTLDLYHHNILYNYNVEIIGATINSIKKAEDRKLFEKCMKKIGLKTAKCEIVNNIKTAYKVINKIGFPAIIRPSFTMGGSGGGIAYNYEEFTTICKTGLKISPTKELLIDESLIGWKEYEMEVVRDKHDNCLVICSIENIDPMGIHTGDSITITPAQTLTDKEYQIMRNASISILREIGVETGGANVQFAINPKTGKMIVIEMNPRVSRSSALASKATGVPIAKISAQLAIGLTLDEIKNDMIGENTTASFEPSIDYVVTKIPRFNFEKFPGCNDRLTTQMKSVGEVMAIGRTFQESIQKAMQSLEIGVNGFDSKIKNYNKKTQIAKIKRELKEAGSERLWYIADAFRMKMTISEIFHLTLIDKWFLFHIKELIDIEEQIKKININSLNYNYFKFLKQKGFSDLRIAKLTNSSEQQIRNKRHNLKLYPVYKRIDTCAAEFSNNTAYMYSTWEDECESNPTNNKKIIIVGGGPNRIGQGIEFDYCCVHATQILKKDGFETIMINCNPETVSTDYDISDRLYFEPVTLEKILEIVKIEKPYGVIIQYGGQTPLKLAKDLEKENAPIIGTSPNSIDQAENRKYFQKIVSKLKLKQPLNSTVNTLYEALNQAKNIKYPIMIRPSYVLGGQSMEIVNNDRDLTNYFQNTFNKFKQASILLDHYLEEATEVDVDAICDGKNVLIGGIMEHIEPAGIHSGDSACSLPVYTLSPSIQKEIKSQVKKLAISLSVKGLMNVQFAIKNKEIYIIEVNPRASRTIPFVSKATGLPLAKIAARVMIGKTLIEQNYVHEITPSFYSVKEVVLPFNKFYGVVPTLGPEMKSTGEVMGIGKNFQDAFSKAMLGAQIDMKRSGRVLISVKDNDKNKIIPLAIKLKQNGFKLDATNGTAIKLINSGISVRKVNKVHEGRLNVLDRLKNNEYVYIINTTNSKQTLHDSKVIYYIAIQNHIHYDTTINGAHATIMAITTNPKKYITSLQDMHKTQKKIKNNL